MKWLALLLLAVSAPAQTLVTWDTNQIGSPVSLYRATLLGTTSGTQFALESSLTNTTVFVIGTTPPPITVTNYVTITNFVWKTNVIVVTVTNVVGKPPKK